MGVTSSGKMVMWLSDLGSESIWKNCAQKEMIARLVKNNAHFGSLLGGYKLQMVLRMYGYDSQYISFGIYYANEFSLALKNLVDFQGTKGPWHNTIGSRRT